MKKYSERFSSVDVLDKIADAKKLIEKIDSQGVTFEIAEYLQRTNAVLDLAESRFQEQNRLLWTVATTNALNKITGDIANQLTQFENDPQEKVLEQVSNLGDNLLIHLARMPISKRLEDIKVLETHALGISESATLAIQKLKKESSELQSEYEQTAKSLNELKAEIDNQKGRLDNAIVSFQNQFSESQEKRRSESENVQKEQRETYDRALASFRTKLNGFERLVKATEEDCKSNINDLHKEAESKFKAQMEQFSDSYLEVIQKQNDLMLELRTKTDETVQDLLGEVEKQRGRAQNIVGVIANTGMAGGYQKVADEEQKSAKLWKRGAVASLIILSILTIVWLFQPKGDLTWELIAMRFLLFGSLAGVATYAARQGFRHEQAARNNRILELELASLDPYLAELPADTRVELKTMFAQRVFGRRADEEKFHNMMDDFAKVLSQITGKKES